MLRENECGNKPYDNFDKNGIIPKTKSRFQMGNHKEKKNGYREKRRQRYRAVVLNLFLFAAPFLQLRTIWRHP